MLSLLVSDGIRFKWIKRDTFVIDIRGSYFIVDSILNHLELLNNVQRKNLLAG